jgi:hypothetical protein
MASRVRRSWAGGSGSSGSSSVLTGPPTRAKGQPAKLWATNRLDPAARAAASRWSVPTVRRRLVSANPSSSLRKSVIPARAVSSCTTTSGRAATTARSTASRSRASATTGSAPAARRPAALPAVRVMPVTWWPPWTSSGTSRRPSAPVAPATKILMVDSFRGLLSSQTRRPGGP